jgi:DNA-binding NarL/FixJ family response regulator
MSSISLQGFPTFADALIQAQVITASVSPGLEKHFMEQARRVGVSNVDDFLSCVLLECLETSSSDEQSIRKAIDRVKKRIERQSRKQVTGMEAVVDAQAAPTRRLIPLLDEFSGEELAILELLSQGHNYKQIASEIGISSATYYRVLARIKQNAKQH